MTSALQVADEENFLKFEEKVVYDLQRIFRSKPGMELHAVVDMCARLEDIVYNEALREYSLGNSANVWSKKECITFYQERCSLMLKNLEEKPLNWKKVFEDNEKDAMAVLHVLTKDTHDKKFKLTASQQQAQLKRASLGYNSKGTSSRPRSSTTADTSGSVSTTATNGKPIAKASKVTKVKKNKKARLSVASNVSDISKPSVMPPAPIEDDIFDPMAVEGSATIVNTTLGDNDAGTSTGADSLELVGGTDSNMDLGFDFDFGDDALAELEEDGEPSAETAASWGV